MGCAWKGARNFSYWTLPCVSFPPCLIAHEAQESENSDCAVSQSWGHSLVRESHRAQTTRPYLNFCVTKSSKNPMNKMEEIFVLLFHQHFSPVVICSFLAPKRKQNQPKLVRAIESIIREWERMEPPKVFNFLEPTKHWYPTRGNFQRDA